MDGQGTIDLIWWITVVELPALASLFWLVWRGRQDMEKATEDNRRYAETISAQARDGLMVFKLEVAKSYASIALLKEVEARLTRHLLRIEHKLDEVSARPNEA